MNDPSAQAEQFTVPSVDVYVFTGQYMQLEAPVILLNVPPLQGWQLVKPDTLIKEPSGHS